MGSYMSETESEVVRGYHIEFTDSFLDVTDFVTIEAESEEAAEEEFREGRFDSERHDIQEISEVYAVDVGTAQRLLGDLEHWG